MDTVLFSRNRITPLAPESTDYIDWKPEQRQRATYRVLFGRPSFASLNRTKLPESLHSSCLSNQAIHGCFSENTTSVGSKGKKRKPRTSSTTREPNFRPPSPKITRKDTASLEEKGIITADFVMDLDVTTHGEIPDNNDDFVPLDVIDELLLADDTTNSVPLSDTSPPLAVDSSVQLQQLIEMDNPIAPTNGSRDDSRLDSHDTFLYMCGDDTRSGAVAEEMDSINSEICLLKDSAVSASTPTRLDSLEEFSEIHGDDLYNCSPSST